jgi:hypothetical protein
LDLGRAPPPLNTQAELEVPLEPNGAEKHKNPFAQIIGTAQGIFKLFGVRPAPVKGGLHEKEKEKRKKPGLKPGQKEKQNLINEKGGSLALKN